MVKARLMAEDACCRTYKLIIMDMDMPVLNGFQASINIKECLQHKPEAGKCRICLHTAYYGQKIEEMFSRLKINLRLPKPFTQQQLQEVLNKCKLQPLPGFTSIAVIGEGQAAIS